MSPSNEGPDHYDLVSTYLGDPAFEAEVAKVISSDTRIRRIRESADARILKIEREIRMRLSRIKAREIKRQFIRECNRRTAPVVGPPDTRRFVFNSRAK